MNPASLPPGPKAYPLVGNLPDIRLAPLDFLLDCARTYGDVVQVDLGFGRKFLLISHPSAIEQVLVGTTRQWELGRGPHTAFLFGEGLFNTWGEAWRHQRRLMTPAFRRECILDYATLITEESERVLGSWHSGQTRDVHEDIRRLTLTVIGRCLFNDDLAQEGSRLGAALQYCLYYHTTAATRFPLWFPLPLTLRYRQEVHRMKADLEQKIRERRQSPSTRQDLLALLMQAEDEHGQQLTDQQLRDEMITILMAGNQTTASAITFALYLLASHPAVAQQMQAELEQVVGDAPLTLTDLEQLPYTGMVVQESLRLYPPASFFRREALAECEVGGYVVPRGASVGFSSWVVHRDPRYYESPESFMPERWAQGLARQNPKYAYFPFSGGPRSCLGSPLALLIIKTVLACITRRFHLQVAPNYTLQPQTSLTLHPRHGLPLIIHARAAAADRASTA